MNDKGNSFANGFGGPGGTHGTSNSQGGCPRPDCMPREGNPCGWCIGNR